VRIARFTVSFPPGRSANQADAELISDALWAHAVSDDEIAHITATALSNGIDIVIFLNSEARNPERLIDQLRDSVPEYPGTNVSPTIEEI
jgi:hypothetical protein